MCVDHDDISCLLELELNRFCIDFTDAYGVVRLADNRLIGSISPYIQPGITALAMEPTFAQKGDHRFRRKVGLADQDSPGAVERGLFRMGLCRGKGTQRQERYMDGETCNTLHSAFSEGDRVLVCPARGEIGNEANGINPSEIVQIITSGNIPQGNLVGSKKSRIIRAYPSYWQV